jgi:hypothetical protein
MAMTLPDRNEWNPILSSILKPNDASQTDATTAWIFVLIWFLLSTFQFLLATSLENTN